MYNFDHLISVGIFNDNEYLYKYYDILCQNQHNEKVIGQTEKHHIIPKSYYRLMSIQVDDSTDNLIHLSFKDHILVHYYMFLCVNVPKIKKDMAAAVIFMTSPKSLTVSEQKFIEELPSYALLRETFINRMREQSSGKTPTDESKQKRRITYNLNKEMGKHKPYQYREPWNKGLNKVVDSRLLQMGKNISNTIRSKEKREPVNKGVPMDDEIYKNHLESHRTDQFIDKMKSHVGYNNSTYGKKCYYNVNTLKRKYFKDGDVIPSDFVQGHPPMSDETRQKISSSVKEVSQCQEYKDNLSNKIKSLWQSGFYKNRKCVAHEPWNKGLTKDTDSRLMEISIKKSNYVASQETRDKISMSSTGRLPVNSVRVLCIESNVTYESLKQASQSTGISLFKIRKSIQDKNYMADGLHWIKLEDINDNNK